MLESLASAPGRMAYGCELCACFLRFDLRMRQGRLGDLAIAEQWRAWGTWQLQNNGVLGQGEQVRGHVVASSARPLSVCACACARGAVEDLAVSLERLAFTLDGQVFSPGAARLVQVDP